MCEDEVPYSHKESNTEEWLCELGICECSGTSLYLLHIIHAHLGIGYYVAENKCGWLLCFKFNSWQL